MERTSICVACLEYRAMPVSLSVDPACQSAREVDALCGLHRARATEGYCVVCGRREPWVSPWPESRIGACRACFVDLFGSREAQAVEERLEIQARGEAEEISFP